MKSGVLEFHIVEEEGSRCGTGERFIESPGKGSIVRINVRFLLKGHSGGLKLKRVG